jgi:hypothetical protein
VRNRIVESCEVEITNPATAARILSLDSVLELSVGFLPSSKEEDAVLLLQDIAEDDFELSLRSVRLDSFGSQVSKCLKHDLVFNAQECNRSMQA